MSLVMSVLTTGSLANLSPENDDSPKSREEQPVGLDAPNLVIPEPDDMLVGQVVRVLDGDTLLVRVDGTNYLYQLLASDTPEYIPSDRTPAPFSREARQFIEQKLLGEIVYIQYDPIANRDKKKRRVVYLFRAPDMLFVNLELIRQGYAKYNPRGSTLYHDSFEYYSDRAQHLERGIWNPDFDSVSWANSPSDEPESVVHQTVDETSSTTNSTDPKKPAADPGDPDVVYITKSGKSYHKKGCPHLTNTQHPTRLEDVKDTHAPCKTCKPDG